MKGFVKVPNDIFDFTSQKCRKLKPSAFAVYVYFLSRAKGISGVQATYNTLSRACNISPKTAKTAVAELTALALIEKRNRYCCMGYAANLYFIKKQASENGKWFSVPREIFNCNNICPTDFLIYCFLRKCMSADKLEAFPSAKIITAATGVSHSRVVKATAFLRRFTFINRIHRRYRKTKAHRHNRYIDFKCNQGEKRELIPLQGISSQIYNTKKRIYIIALKKQKCKRCVGFFIFKGGGVFFTQQPYTHKLLPIKKKLYLTNLIN